MRSSLPDPGAQGPILGPPPRREPSGSGQLLRSRSRSSADFGKKKKNVTHPACLQRKEKYVWHPSFLKSSASAWQSYVARLPCGPWREHPLLATTQRNTGPPAWVGLQGTAFNAVMGRSFGKKISFPSATSRALWSSRHCSGDDSIPCDTVKGDALKRWIFVVVR